jgi:hypothetical protein
MNLNGGKITTLFSLTSNGNLVFHSVTNVGNKVIYGLYTPNMSVNFITSYYLSLKC